MTWTCVHKIQWRGFMTAYFRLIFFSTLMHVCMPREITHSVDFDFMVWWQYPHGDCLQSLVCSLKFFYLVATAWLMQGNTVGFLFNYSHGIIRICCVRLGFIFAINFLAVVTLNLHILSHDDVGFYVMHDPAHPCYMECSPMGLLINALWALWNVVFSWLANLVSICMHMKFCCWLIIGPSAACRSYKNVHRTIIQNSSDSNQWV